MMMRTGLVLITVMVAAFGLQAQKTTRKNLSAIPAVVDSTTVTAPNDTLLAPDGSMIELFGYEKPLNSRKESFHVRNNSDGTVTMLALTLTYLDYRGEELHRRTVNLKCNVPPHSTRLLTFRSWDVQNRFYYADGPTPRSEAYPYDIRITVDKAVVSDK